MGSPEVTFTLRIEFTPIDIRLHGPGDVSNNALGLITKQLSQLKELIMANQQELTQKLNTVAEQQQKTIGEIQALQGKVNELNQTITDLQAVIAAGGESSPELEEAVNKVVQKAQEVDDASPDAPSTL